MDCSYSQQELRGEVWAGKTNLGTMYKYMIIKAVRIGNMPERMGGGEHLGQNFEEFNS